MIVFGYETHDRGILDIREYFCSYFYLNEGLVNDMIGSFFKRNIEIVHIIPVCIILGRWNEVIVDCLNKQKQKATFFIIFYILSKFEGFRAYYKKDKGQLLVSLNSINQIAEQLNQLWTNAGCKLYSFD